MKRKVFLLLPVGGEEITICQDFMGSGCVRVFVENRAFGVIWFQFSYDRSIRLWSVDTEWKKCLPIKGPGIWTLKSAPKIQKLSDFSSHLIYQYIYFVFICMQTKKSINQIHIVFTGGEEVKEGCVTAFAWSPKEGNLLASWDTTFTARLWQVFKYHHGCSMDPGFHSVSRWTQVSNYTECVEVKTISLWAPPPMASLSLLMGTFSPAEARRYLSNICIQVKKYWGFFSGVHLEGRFWRDCRTVWGEYWQIEIFFGENWTFLGNWTFLSRKLKFLKQMNVGMVAWSPDGKQLAVLRSDGAEHEVNLKTHSKFIFHLKINLNFMFHRKIHSN